MTIYKVIAKNTYSVYDPDIDNYKNEFEIEELGLYTRKELAEKAKLEYDKSLNILFSKTYECNICVCTKRNKKQLKETISKCPRGLLVEERNMLYCGNQSVCNCDEMGYAEISEIEVMEE